MGTRHVVGAVHVSAKSFFSFLSATATFVRCTLEPVDLDVAYTPVVVDARLPATEHNVPPHRALICDVEEKIGRGKMRRASKRSTHCLHEGGVWWHELTSEGTEHFVV